MLDPEKCVGAPFSIVDHFLEKSIVYIVWLNSGQIDLSASALFACLKVSSLSPNALKERDEVSSSRQTCFSHTLEG